MTRIKFVWKWLKTVVRTFLDGKCAMHAGALTYYSMLALVPVMCVLLLVAKTLGADQFAKEKLHAQFESHISRFEESMGLTESVAVEQPSAQEAVAAGADESAEDGGDATSARTEKTEPPRHVLEEEQKRQATADFIRQARSLECGLLERVDQFNIGTLGWIGFLMLVWTVIGSIGMVEVSFNEIWGVHRQRALWRRIILYLFVTIVLPILSALAFSVPLLKLVKDIIVSTVGALWLTRWMSDGAIWLLDSWLLRTTITYFFATGAFAFLFSVLPNCRVRFRSALGGGFVTAVLFMAWFKLCVVAQVGIAKTSALYGSFAFLPIVLAWIYMSWQIILLGCCMIRATVLLCPNLPKPDQSSQSGDNQQEKI